VLVRELLVAELAVVEVPADVDVPMHADVVAGGVVLPTVHAHVALLSSATCIKHFLTLTAVFAP
jgi:hypothetical protein